MSGDASVAAQIAALRRDFDASFAVEALAPARDLIALLLVRSGGMLQAVPVADLVSVEHCPALVPLPGQHAAFLGLAALRGRPTSVFSLDALLGFARAEAGPRWILGIDAQVAVAVASIEGHRQVRPMDVRRDRADGSQPLVRFGDAGYPLVDLAALLRPLLAPDPPRSTTP